jgi:hypothetical protein
MSREKILHIEHICNYIFMINFKCDLSGHKGQARLWIVPFLQG